jgi:hypothetical protein
MTRNPAEGGDGQPGRSWMGEDSCWKLAFISPRPGAEI